MVYGNYCPVCRGIVDNSEYDFYNDMCNECVTERELEDIRRTDVAKIMNSKCEQMVLEV